MSLPEIKNQYLLDWLQYTGGSETPPLFNLWSGISTAAACLGRRVTHQQGRFSFVPNLYVVLVGPPAVRKSSSASIGAALLKEHTSVKFGPNDTGGKRQGLYSAFMDAYGDNEEEDVAADHVTKDLDMFKMNAGIAGSELISQSDALAAFFNTPTKFDTKKDDNRPRDLFVFADEFGTFIGMNQLEMVNFLADIYYPKDKMEYKLSNSTRTIKKPGFNLLACTTPTSLTSHLPPTSIGQGFSSRTIFVYEGKAQPKVFPAPPLDVTLGLKLGELLGRLSEMELELSITEDAERFMYNIYINYEPNVGDSRFNHYEQRRMDHLTKIAMVLACCRNDDTIRLDDALDAHVILQATEVNMKHALGELGISKLSLAKQAMKEMIEASWPHGISRDLLRVNALRDMRAMEFTETLSELEQKGICRTFEAKSKNGGKYMIVMPKAPESHEALFVKPEEKKNRSVAAREQIMHNFLS